MIRLKSVVESIIMQLHISPSLKHITVSNSGSHSKLKAARRFSFRNIFYWVLFIFVLRFFFIISALANLEGQSHCTNLVCFGRRLGPRLLKTKDASFRSGREMLEILQRENVSIPEGVVVPNSFEELVADMKKNDHDTKTFAMLMKAMIGQLEHRTRIARMNEYLYRHVASSSIPKGMHCLSLKLADEYSSNVHARSQLPSPEFVPRLIDNSFQHFILATDNVLAASVVVSSTISNSARPDKIVFHIITDKKTYSPMHTWFSLHPRPPAVIEVRGLHQFTWLMKDKVPVLQHMVKDYEIRRNYFGDVSNAKHLNDSPYLVAAKLQAQSPKYFSVMNHIRIYLPQLFPNLNKVVFLDDDIVVQRDLSPLWDINLQGSVNGAVETCRGDDSWVMSKKFKNYFNFSHPLIADNFDPEQCAWAYGMNIFDLQAWRKTNIKEIYHYWLKQNLESNLALWRLGTLPPALIAFNGLVHPIDPSWHMLGLGYQPKTSVENIQKAAVIHYNGRAKPWLDIAFPELRPFWTKYVDFSDRFMKHCNIANS
eukprot:TRINITY_DN2205_c0_g1_i1.p1 TRINITY_DN2205_c0_g1~~TRINITY_DN2205_c0_g1_i1.p1  ORF type:complete len:539 (+),score=45.55 TRINITY_DN2205_c0_g1_i1:107-1723(+)